MFTEKDIRDIKRLLAKANKRDPEVLTESEAAALLGITTRTIQNYVSQAIIPPTYYTVGIKGQRFYFKNKLIGLE